MITKKENYNNVPICYCKTCLSINIKDVEIEDKTVAYCIDCGNTNLNESHITEWEEKYKDKYGKKFLENGTAT